MPSSVPAVGSPAPDFTLPSTDGRDVSLASLRGRTVLLAFFPLAFTSTCTQEMCDLRDDWDQFASADTIVLPISVDSTPTLGEFRKQLGLEANMLSDFRRDVARQYGVLIEERFFATRAYFLIDRGGIIRWVHVEDNPGLKRSNAEILAQIAAIA
jgi:peroxiredoxin